MNETLTFDFLYNNPMSGVKINRWLKMCLFFFGSILAEEFLTSHEKYEQEARKHTEESAMQSRADMEKVNEW